MKFLSVLKKFSRRNSHGFTLIELLVVIGILGILAAALIATIDPFEQLKKADDANIKNMSVEFQTANVRYYTTHGAFPWDDAASNLGNCTGLGLAGGVPAGTIVGLALNGVGMKDCLGIVNAQNVAPSNSLIGEGELKTGFASVANNLKRVYVNWDSAKASDMVVCFSPKSRSQKAAPDTKFDKNGGANAACPNANAADDVCYWCTQ